MATDHSFGSGIDPYAPPSDVQAAAFVDEAGTSGQFRGRSEGHRAAISQAFALTRATAGGVRTVDCRCFPAGVVGQPWWS